MRGYTLSIAGMLMFIAIVGLCLAAMRSVSPWPTMLATTATLGALLSGVLGLFFLRGDGRAFSAGFALFGVVYLVLVDWDWVGGQIGHDLTRGIADFAEDRVFPMPTGPNQGYFAFETHQQRQTVVGNFVQVVRLLFSAFFGAVGGCVAVAMAARTRARRSQESR